MLRNDEETIPFEVSIDGNKTASNKDNSAEL